MKITKKTKEIVIYVDPTVKRLSTSLRKIYKIELEYLQRLSDSERTAMGTFEKWAPKDVIAHNMYWRRRAIETLAYALRGQPAPQYPPYDEVNRENFERFHTLALHGILMEAEKTVNTLADSLAPFSEADLNSNENYSWRTESPLIAHILDNCLIHPLSHLADSYIHFGDRNAAKKQWDDIIQWVGNLTDNPYTLALSYYSRAAFLVSQADPQAALADLEKTFELHSSFKSWAPKDQDLKSLYDDPRFQELTAQEPE